MRRSAQPLLALVFLLGSFTAAAASGQAQQPVATLATAQEALDRGDPDSALRLIATVLKRDPKSAPALLVRSTASCMAGEVEKCKKDLDLALTIDPKLRQGWLNRSALAIADERWDEALAALAEAERLDPSALDNALNQGAVQLLRGDLEAATGQFRRHLERSPSSADAWFLVATNYAHAGYAALALEHLGRAIELDEQSRLRARTDANFTDLAANSSFQRLLVTDGWRAPAGSGSAERTFRTRYTGAESPLLIAILNVVQLAGTQMLPQVEITDDWALLWAQFRVKLIRNADNTTTVRLTAIPGTYFPATWESTTADFFSQVENQLMRLQLAAGRKPPPPRP